MADTILKPKTPLNGYCEPFSETKLVEVTDMALVAIAIPRNGAVALQTAIRAAYGCALPKVGSSVVSSDGSMRLLGMQQDQVFAFFAYSGDTAVAEIRNKLDDAGYYVDQSDSWAMLRLSGTAALAALERVCPLDLNIGVFPIGTVARTVMEHMGVIILREGTDAFLLMGARSSAANFCHAVEQSIRNVT